MMMTTSRFGESVPVRTLADGHVIPSLALGVWQTPEGGQTKDAVRWALELGYRHIGIERNYVFIPTKSYPGSEEPVGELQWRLRRPKLDYVYLYIVHWPQG